MSTPDTTVTGTKVSAKQRIQTFGYSLLHHPAVIGDSFISRKFKLDFIIKFCAIAMAAGVIISAVLLYYCRGSLTTSFVDGRLAIEETSLAVLPSVIYTNLIMLSMAIVAMVIITFYLSYRLRKPLFRFQQDIRAITAGDLTTSVRYRREDQTMQLAKDINRMTESIRGQIIHISASFEKTINASTSADIPNELGINLLRLHRTIGQRFKL